MATLASGVDGRVTSVIVQGIPAERGTRFNNVIVDGDGRVISGTMAIRGRAGTIDRYGSLYILHTDGSYHRLLEGMGSPNGMRFTADGCQMYLTESMVGIQSIFRFDVDAMQLAASPSPETFHAAGHDVIQVSRDGGQTWQPLANNLPGTDIHGFAQEPADANRLYASVVGAGAFTSADGGTTWVTLPTQPPGGGALASSGTGLYAAMAASIVTSSDQGVTWTPLSAQPSVQVISLAIPASDPQTLYVGTPSGLAKSTDGGASWTTLGPQGVPILALAVTPTDPSRVLLVSDKGAIYRSNDGWTTWQSPGD